MLFCHCCRQRLCGFQGNVLLFVRPWMDILDMNHDASVVFMNTNAISACIGVRSMLRCRCLRSFTANSRLYGLCGSRFSECRCYFMYEQKLEIYSVLLSDDSLNPPHWGVLINNSLSVSLSAHFEFPLLALFPFLPQCRLSPQLLLTPVIYSHLKFSLMAKYK